jgi:hypothetical protein
VVGYISQHCCVFLSLQLVFNRHGEYSISSSCCRRSTWICAVSLFEKNVIYRIFWESDKFSIPIYIQQDATLHSLLICGDSSTCFVWYLHSSLGAHTTVSTAAGICHTVTATCGYCGRDGSGLSVLWLAYATHSTLKPVPTLPRLRQIAVTV